MKMLILFIISIGIQQCFSSEETNPTSSPLNQIKSIAQDLTQSIEKAGSNNVLKMIHHHALNLAGDLEKIKNQLQNEIKKETEPQTLLPLPILPSIIGKDSGFKSLNQNLGQTIFDLNRFLPHPDKKWNTSFDDLKSITMKNMKKVVEGIEKIVKENGMLGLNGKIGNFLKVILESVLKKAKEIQEKVNKFILTQTKMVTMKKKI